MCVFCKVKKDLIILESEHSFVIANFFPLTSISLLAIPKRHVYSITELEKDELSDLMQIITLAMNNIKAKAKPKGLNIFANEGRIAGQTVPHFHFHIVARNEDDGLENFKRKDEEKKKAITKKGLKIIKEMF